MESTSQSVPSVPQAQAPAQPPTTTLESKPVKKPKTAAQLAALAKGREAKRQKALDRGSNSNSKQVVRDDDSTNESLERVNHSDPEAKVTRRKRKGYEGYDSYSEGNGSSGTTVKVVVAALAVAALGGMAFVGSKKLPLQPAPPQSVGASKQEVQTNSTGNAPSAVSLSTSQFG